jgi:stalled ribosome rescue protein Dom34
MTEHHHAVVWIDHHEARIFHFNAQDMDRVIVRPDDPHVHIHHKAGVIGSGHAHENNAFFHAVVEALGTSMAVLVTGPGNAKTELVKYVARNAAPVLDRIAGVETVDHPSDAALVAHARHYFRTADRKTPQMP